MNCRRYFEQVYNEANGDQMTVERLPLSRVPQNLLMNVIDFSSPNGVPPFDLSCLYRIASIIRDQPHLYRKHSHRCTFLDTALKIAAQNFGNSLIFPVLAAAQASFFRGEG